MTPEELATVLRGALKQQFGALIESARQEATGAERERCAKIICLAEPIGTFLSDENGNKFTVVDWDKTADMIETQIRYPVAE